MAFKLLVLMVAVSALEGVFGLPDKQLVNGTQSKAIVGHGKTQRGRRLDKLACIIFHGHCQRLDEPCDGVLEEGPEWCLHSRHFGCCIPQSDTLGCSLNGRVYRDGSITEDGCIRLMCRTGEWLYHGWNEICGFACIIGTTIMPFVPHLPLHDEYNMTGYQGVYSLSQYGLGANPLCGVDIYIAKDGVECILYYCPGLTVEICCDMYDEIYDEYPAVWVNGHYTYPFPKRDLILLSSWCGGCGPVYIYFDWPTIYIIGSQLSVVVSWYPEWPYCPFDVYVLATTSLYGELYGLFGVWVPLPYPFNCTMLNGEETDDLDELIRSWQVKGRRNLIGKHRKNPSSDHTGQVAVQPIIERSMEDIAKLCEETNKGPCTLSPEKCEKIMDYCMSRMSNVSKPGHGGLSDSSE